MSEHWPKKKRTHSRLRSGSDVLQALFENGSSPLSIQFIRWKLWKKWGEYVGQTIAAASEPVGYYRGTLYVWVKSSTWMQQMVFMKEAMKKSINQKLEMTYVWEIRFTLDKKSIPQDAQVADELRKSIEVLMADHESEDAEG